MGAKTTGVITQTNRTPLIAMLIANAVSLIGSRLTLLAIPWFVLVTTGSAAKTGLAGFFETLPAVIAAFFGGTIVDRLGFKRTSIIADITSGVAVALVPLLHHTVGLAFWQLLVLIFLRSLLDTPGSTARLSLLPDLVDLAGMRRERVNAAYQSIQNFSALLGPSLAGILVVVLSPSNVLWLDAVSFVLSAALIAGAVPSAPRPAEADQTVGRYLAELSEGLQFIRRSRLILSVITTIAFGNLLIPPLLAVILPVYANQIFGSAVDFGLMLSGYGGGSLAGAVLFGAIGHRLSRRATFIGAFLVSGLPFWILTMTPTLIITVGTLVILGAAIGPINPLVYTVAQERIPAEMRGRVFGMFTAIGFVAMPFGMVLTGYLLENTSLRITLIILAVGYLVMTLSLLVNPALHDMNTPKEMTGEDRTPVA